MRLCSQLFVSAIIIGLSSLAASADEPKPLCQPERHGGAPDDGESDTAAIQAAISACAGTGGVAVLSNGVWLTGGLTLGGDMTFRLEEGAVLRLIPDMALYTPLDLTRGDDPDQLYAALHAPGVVGLRLEGPGVIDGSGPEFWDENFYDLGIPRPTLPRPKPVVELADCRDVVVDGLRMENLPSFAIRFNRCSGGEVTGVVIRNDLRSPNTDGIQVRDSSDITIRRVDIHTGDDAIVLKSSTRPVERILVEESRLTSDDGAVKFGTGSHHGVRDSVFRDLDVTESRYGVAIFMIDGGAHRDNRFEDIRIETGGRHDRTYPIFVDIDRREADRSLGEVNGLTFRNIEIISDGASLIAGNPDAPIQDLSLEGINVTRKTTPQPLDRRRSKPRGNVTIQAQAGSVDHSREPAEMVIAHAREVAVTDMRFPDCAQLGGRRAVSAIDVGWADGSAAVLEPDC